MASFTGSFLARTAIESHYRVFLVRWFKRNSGVSCAKSRDYSSSFPVKYIPKKSSRNKESEAPLPLKYMEEKDEHNSPDLYASRAESFNNLRDRFPNIESMNHDQWRVNNLKLEEDIEDDSVDLNVDFIEEPEEVIEDFLKTCSEMQAGKAKKDVEKLAIELLATRAFTALELKKRLQGKRFPLDNIDKVIMEFQSRGLINDCLYAETFSRSRWTSSSWGPRRIKQALLKKGINALDAENAIKLVFENGESSGDQNSGAMSKVSFDQLYVQASKQWQRSHGVHWETRKSRIVRWLQYRGFNWGVIKDVLKKLESECP